MNACPLNEQLVSLLADMLSPAEQDAIVRHLEECASCQEKLARLADSDDATTWRGPVPPLLGSAAEDGMVRRLQRMQRPAAAGRPEAARSGSDASRSGGAAPEVPGYAIVRELGRGGMSVVYEARQLALQRTVALKVVLTGIHSSPKDLARFRAEAEVIARLHHPNIVQIFDVGEAAGHPYIVLEFAAGGSLAGRLNGTPQPARSAAQLVVTLARAVHSAHAGGVVHRDLKPANVLLIPADPAATIVHDFAQDLDTPAAEGTWLDAIPKITDFGVAKRVEGNGDSTGAPGLTVSGEFLGTPSYMAPEQAAIPRQEVGPTADVYALGAILYELLTGRPPFKGETPLDTVLQVLHNDPVPVTDLQPKVPRDLETICLKCLRKDPRKRYGSALELAEDVQRFLGTSLSGRGPP